MNSDREILESSLIRQEKSMNCVYGSLQSGETCEHVQYRSIAIPCVPTLSRQKAKSEIRHDLRKDDWNAYSTLEAAGAAGNNYVGVAPLPLPPLPFRLEEHTHFYTKSDSVLRICATIGMWLLESDTDYIFKAKKCKWKVKYRHSSDTQRCEFHISLYLAANDQCIVEAQRRDGDIPAYINAYNALKDLFRKNQFLVEDSMRSAVRENHARNFVSNIPQQIIPTRHHLTKAVSCIWGMLESKHADIQVQGMYGVLSLSTQEEYFHAIASLIPLLLTCGQSSNAKVANLAHVAISKLCEHPVCRDAIMSGNNWQFLVQSASGNSSADSEAQRESLRIIEKLCPTYRTHFTQCGDSAKTMLHLIENWQLIGDAKLRRQAINTHTALREAGVFAC